ncbi:S-layer homology domain-containing protein [Cohnella faecalis]|nr:S-layer homology domain-containing protein [Cohnella faecalis]
MLRKPSTAKRSQRGAWWRGAVALVLAMQVVLGALAGIASAEEAAKPAVGPTRAQVTEALQALQAQLAKAEPVSDWAAFGLARSGKPVASRYLPVAAKSVDDGSLRLVTDFARTALAINANGGDARKVGKGSTDLLGKIANFEKMTAQGPNAPAYALMALDAGDYTPGAKDRWTRDDLIKWLADNRNADGGWSLTPGKSDTDVTAIVLTALAPYQAREDVKPVVEKALVWLSSIQKETGGFGSMGESSESSVQVLIALTSLNIDPVNDSRFVKNGKSALARLLEYRQSDGQFSHTAEGKADAMATFYALLGLTSVDRWWDGLSGLFAGIPTAAPASVTVYGTSGKLAEGAAYGRTGLDALVQALQAKNVSYEVERHPQYGAFLKAVAGTANGSLGGYDGWLYAVKRQGAWLTGLLGLGSFVPQSGDQIVVYYGNSTALIHSVKWEPAVPREGQSVTVTIEQETYDWDAGKAVVAPAEAARVSVGGKSALTDKDGKATLTAGKAGSYTLSMDGYQTGKAPTYVTTEVPFWIDTYNKTVKLRVEGDQGVLAEGTASGGTGLEALESFLKAKKVDYVVKEASFGKYITSIKGIENAKFGGYDGWSFAVKKGNNWIIPAVGLDAFALEDGQEVVVYYGDNTKLAESVVVTPSAPKPGEAFSIQVTSREMDWETGKLKAAAPVAGVQVKVGAATATTDGTGAAKFAGVKEGLHDITISGYAEGKAPAIVRSVQKLAVASAYSDQSAVSKWALDSVRLTKAAGVLLGSNDNAAAAFQPKASVTRAEFVSALVRSIGLKPASGSTFKDVKATAWYAKELEAAAQAGLVAGVAPGTFAPDAKLTREQAAQLLTRALKLQAKASVALADSAQISAGAVSSVQAVVGRGIMIGDERGRFLPKQTLTREQAAVIAQVVLNEPGVGIWSK